MYVYDCECVLCVHRSKYCLILSADLCECKMIHTVKICHSQMLLKSSSNNMSIVFGCVCVCVCGWTFWVLLIFFLICVSLCSVQMFFISWVLISNFIWICYFSSLLPHSSQLKCYVNVEIEKFISFDQFTKCSIFSDSLNILREFLWNISGIRKLIGACCWIILKQKWKIRVLRMYCICRDDLQW